MAEELKNGNSVTENGNQGQNGEQPQQPADQQPHVNPQKKTEETMVGVPSWLVKAWNGTRKASKYIIPLFTAGLGVFMGVKFGSSSASKKAQVTIDGLAQELSDTRLALEQKPEPFVPPIEVTDVSIDAVSNLDSIPMDVVE